MTKVRDCEEVSSCRAISSFWITGTLVGKLHGSMKIKGKGAVIFLVLSHQQDCKGGGRNVGICWSWPRNSVY